PAKFRALRLIPLSGQRIEAECPDGAIRRQKIGAEIFGSPAAPLAVELKQQVAMTLHLCPAEGAEGILFLSSKDVWRTPLIPEDFGTLSARWPTRIIGSGCGLEATQEQNNGNYS